MITALVGAALLLQNTAILVTCTVAVGFFTGFYIVPLYTLLQHKAPRTSKGEMIATSNFINVTGAIASSLLFFGVVTAAHKSGLAPEITERQQLGYGELTELVLHRGRPVYFEVNSANGIVTPGERPPDLKAITFREIVDDVIGKAKREDVIEVANGLTTRKYDAPGTQVLVTRFDLDGVSHYELSGFGDEINITPDYDNKRLPSYLFLGAAVLTLLIVIVLAKPLLDVQRTENPG